MFVTWATAEDQTPTRCFLCALELVLSRLRRKHSWRAADLWHADIPTKASPGVQVEGVRDDGVQNRGCDRYSWPSRRARTKIGEAFDLSCERTHGFGRAWQRSTENGCLTRPILEQVG